MKPMRIRRAFVSVLMTVVIGCSKPTPIVRTTAKAPATRVEPVTDTVHGVAIVDDYRWLEGNNTNPEVQGEVTPDVAAWTDAQNAYTRQVLDTLPGRAAVEARLKPLMEIGSVTAPIMRANRYFYSKREGTQNQPLIYWREGAWNESRVLIDPAKIDSTGLTTVEWFSPSSDGSCSRTALTAPATR